MSMSCLAEQSGSQLTIGFATTLREKREIYRFRYRVYVEEMGMRLGSADSSDKLLYDDMDRWAVLIYAKAGEEIVGTQRVNIGTMAEYPEDLAQYLMLPRFEKFYGEAGKGKYAYTSKLMVAPSYRNSAALHLLTAKGYEVYCDQGAHFNFGVCNFHLLRLYEQFGARRIGGPFGAPGYDGVLAPFVILVDDVEHLRAVRSPFYRQARKRGWAGSEAAAWFGREFPEQAGVINSQLVGEDELWEALGKRLKGVPNKVIPLLRGLPAAEASRFLHECGLVMQCRPGDYIARSGFTSHTLKVLLTGRVRTMGPAGAKVVRPGQCFGTVGLVEQPRYVEDVYAATAAEVLVLSRLGFQRFQHSHPDVADKIIRNIASLTGERYRTGSQRRQAAK
jgi:hypothetical protein